MHKNTVEHPRFLGVILAAGEGTRMKSSLAKVLHSIAGKSLIGHVMAAAQGAGVADLAVIVGPDRADVQAEVKRHQAGVSIFEQVERRGTAHAVLHARSCFETGEYDGIIVLFGDTPLLQASTIRALGEAVLAADAGVAVMGFETKNPKGYGRLLTQGDSLVAIREEKDASAAERAINLCNGGLMAIKGGIALEILEKIGNNNAQNEFYLTDAVELALQKGLQNRIITVEEGEAAGVNDRVQLAAAEALMQTRLRIAHLRAGVTMIAPETVFLQTDTKIAPDVVIEPNVVFGAKVEVASNVVIHAFSHIEGAKIAAGASVGPFARLRPGAELAANVKVGNFVEIKNTKLEEGAKVSHLTYLGDAFVGAEANVGAGTITCNYDGVNKFHTRIEAGAFIGSNSALVAPVTIGAGALVASGSVITQDVPAQDLAFGRATQVNKPQGAKKFRIQAEALKKSLNKNK